MPINLSGILSQAKSIYDTVNTQMINSSEIGVNIKLYYPPTYVPCGNCQMTNYGITYKTGGPAPFTLGGCPVCGSSTCQKEVESTNTIKMRVYSTAASSFSKKDFKKLGVSIDQPQGEFLTIGFMSDVVKVRSCNYALFYADEESTIGSIRCNLASDPQPHGFGKDIFFFCFWNRV